MARHLENQAQSTKICIPSRAQHNPTCSGSRRHQRSPYPTLPAAYRNARIACTIASTPHTTRETTALGRDSCKIRLLALRGLDGHVSKNILYDAIKIVPTIRVRFVEARLSPHPKHVKRQTRRPCGRTCSHAPQSQGTTLITYQRKKHLGRSP